MGQDTEIVAELEAIARKLEDKAGILRTGTARDTETVAKLRRIRDSLDGFVGAVETHAMPVHTDVSAGVVPTLGHFLRGTGTEWTNQTAVLGDLSDVDDSSPANTTFLGWNHVSSMWEPKIPLFFSLDDVFIVSPFHETILYLDGSGIVTNDISVKHDEVLVSAGWRPLIANWPAGDFSITAKGLRASNTTDDASFDAVTSTVNVEDTSSGGARVYRGMLIDIDYDYNFAGIDTNLPRGLEIDLDATSTAVVFSACKPQVLKIVATNDANTAFGTAKADVPASIVIQNNRTAQTFPEGAMNVTLEAGANSGACTGTRSAVESSGSGAIKGYQGYVLGLAGCTSAVIGLDAFISTRPGMTRVIGIQSQPKALGSPPANNVIMAYRGTLGHWLCSQGSLFVTSTSRQDPAAFATTHLTHTNFEGAGYFEGLLEVDGTLYADAAVEIVGDAKFTTAGGGWPFGEIWVEGNANTMSVSSAGHTQVTDFDTDGQSNQCSPDHTNDHITIDIAGTYQVTVSITVLNNAGAGHVVHFELNKNNGATTFLNLHGDRTLAAGTDKGNMSLSGLISVSANDTIELWASSDSGAARNITVEDCNLSLVQIGA